MTTILDCLGEGGGQLQPDAAPREETVKTKERLSTSAPAYRAADTSAKTAVDVRLWPSKIKLASEPEAEKKHLHIQGEPGPHGQVIMAE